MPIRIRVPSLPLAYPRRTLLMRCFHLQVSCREWDPQLGYEDPAFNCSLHARDPTYTRSSTSAEVESQPHRAVGDLINRHLCPCRGRRAPASLAGTSSDAAPSVRPDACLLCSRVTCLASPHHSGVRMACGRTRTNATPKLIFRPAATELSSGALGSARERAHQGHYSDTK